jgi:hypothetical protein
MFALLFGLIALMPGQCAAGQALAADEPRPQKHVIVIHTQAGSDSDADAESIDEPVGASSHKQHQIIIQRSGGADLPKVWIGVRISAVPAPLAAHLGERGVMIGNIVKGSPADQAGLEQYDVVIACDGQPVNQPQDLTGAIGKTEAGKSLTLTLLRKAAERQVDVKVVSRPTEDGTELKYPEPEDALAGDALQMHGRMLRLGPNGQWNLEDLGALNGMPDVLKKLGPLDFKWCTPDLLNKYCPDTSAGTAEEQDVQIELNLQVNEDGEKTAIHRLTDGKIDVTHTDADGKETSATYDDAAALKEGDPKAFEIYVRHAPDARGNVFYMAHPAPDRASKLQKQFQIDVRSKIEDAFQRAHEAQNSAMSRYNEQMDEARQAMEKARTQMHMQVRGAPGHAETLVVNVDDDGTIHVKTSADGQEKAYQFKTREAFKTQEPELYDRVKEFLD